MNQRRYEREAKIRRQCDVLADIIISIRWVYSEAETEQKSFIETMIGAAIWYIPKPPDAWTGFISHNALKAFHPDSGVEKPKFSEEHVYPRKVAASMLLQDKALDNSTMNMAFCEKYGRLRYMTSSENKAVQPYQKAGVFSTPDNAYDKAGIALIKVTPEDLHLIKRRDQNTIEYYLDNHQQGSNV